MASIVCRELSDEADSNGVIGSKNLWDLHAVTTIFNRYSSTGSEYEVKCHEADGRMTYHFNSLTWKGISVLLYGKLTILIAGHT